MTPLDQAQARMDESEAARLTFYARLAESELFLLLEAEAEGDQITPRLFPVAGHEFALVFDREERLTDFAGAAPYVALSGRVLAQMLAPADLGLGVNLGTLAEALLPPEALTWLVDTLGVDPEETEAQPEEIGPPKGLPDLLIQALDGKLALATGLARCAYLVGVTYAGGRRGHMLAFVDPLSGAEGSLARTMGEALTFSGIDAGSLDVAFFRADDPICARLARVGLRFDLPDPIAPEVPSAPGMDPDRPPRLR